MPATEISAPRIFTGREWLPLSSLSVSPEGNIASLGPIASPDPASLSLSRGFLCPSFVDVQLYGGGGMLFSNRPCAESIRLAREEHLRTGTTHFQITLNCSPAETMWRAVDACKEYLASGGKGLAGLHLEGPFFSPAKRGAHLAEFVARPTAELAREIVRRTDGLPTFMTVAPEEFGGDGALDLLLASHVRLSLGHSDATHAQARAAFARGIRNVTHLFNAQSQWTSRALGVVGATLESGTARASVVADGLHVDFAGIGLAKRLMGDRLFLITDAVTEDVSGPYKFSRRGGARFEDENGTLSGSALTMIEAVRNCVREVGIPVEEALRMASMYPAEVLGLDAKLGTLEAGKEATFLWLSDELEVLGVWVEGERVV
ncbi:hypothetical protein DFJ74DRAFT_603085 [Hyaloraphidium curvatum]|nr:hypothetical protein DFJ74DRAFT_603085 [Hyaloraphidium curvatum]